MTLLAGSGFGNSGLLIFFVLMLGLMYFTMIRPQKKQQQKRKEMLSKIKKGDSVITISGLHGVVDKIDDADKTITLDCDGIYLTFSRGAVRGLDPQKVSAAATTAKPKEVSGKSEDKIETKSAEKPVEKPEEKTEKTADSKPESTDNSEDKK